MRPAMTATVVPAVPPTLVPVIGGGLFPVRRVFCVGRNYADHALEMGGDPEREPPFFFTKPADAVTLAERIPFASETAQLEYEAELVVAIGTGGSDIAAGSALDHVFGYTVGCDLTRRDLQAAAKKAGRPWDMAKGFDQSAPLAPIMPASRLGHPSHAALTLAVNGVLKQQGDISQMTWPVPAVIAFLSRYVALVPGDLIFTGTPAGVGPLAKGDDVEINAAGIARLRFKIV
jgi:fumarylpyruvate hydrolase